MNRELLHILMSKKFAQIKNENMAYINHYHFNDIVLDNFPVQISILELTGFIHFYLLTLKKFSKLHNKDVLGLNISFFYIINKTKFGNAIDNKPYNFLFKIPLRNIKLRNHNLILDNLCDYFCAYNAHTIGADTMIEIVSKNVTINDVIIGKLPKNFNSIFEFTGKNSVRPFVKPYEGTKPRFKKDGFSDNGFF